jgi:repressor LexA
MSSSDLSPKETWAFRFIRNSLIQSGKSPSIRQIQKELKYGSPRSAAVIVEELIRKRWIERGLDGLLKVIREPAEINSTARTVPIPLVGTVACGAPMLAQENIEAMIPVSTALARPGHRYFLLRAMGESMNQAAINDGDLVLVRQQSTADSGMVVVALIDDEATIKEYHRTSNAVILKPKSSDKNIQPIILTQEFQIQGVVIASFSGLE